MDSEAHSEGRLTFLFCPWIDSKGIKRDQKRLSTALFTILIFDNFS